MRLVLAALFLLVAACTPASQDQIARSAAKEAVRPVLLERFPGIPLEGATDCVIDNANAQELFALASDSVTGPTASTVEIVGRILSRPDTIDCLIREGATLAIAGGFVR